MESDERSETGRAALAAGRWEEARAAFEASLAHAETAEAHEGLGAALWWLCESRASARHRERAFVLFREAGAHDRACAVAVDLVITYLVNLGNAAAARGWLARAERVAESLDPNTMKGWLSLMAGYLERDPDRARELFEDALTYARRIDDRDLELVALADLGVALVLEGAVDEGMKMLDEAMAGTMGGERTRLETVVYNCCSMLAACHRANDLERATQWCRVADDFMRDYSCPFLFARCRVHYGSLLVTTGQWERADGELRAAIDLAADAGPGPRAEALARLAELRVRQGRFEEAEALLDACEDARAAALPHAELLLAQDKAPAAAALLDRHLSRISDDVRELAPALALLVEARLGCGDVEAAASAADRLGEVAADGGDHARALWALADAHVLRARGDASRPRLEEALELFARLDLPFDAARARLELARALVEEPTVAATEAKAALRDLERIGATAYAGEAAALLRTLGERVRRGARDLGVLTSREREVLHLVGLGLSNPEIAERLFISRKTAAHHVSNVLTKLGMRNRAELAAYATRSQARRS